MVDFEHLYHIVFCIERITTKEVFMYSHGHGIRAADSCKKNTTYPNN